jgi:hypothetical protein
VGYAETMGRTALYRDPIPFSSPRAEIQLDSDALLVRMPDGRPRRYVLDGCDASALDGCHLRRIDGGAVERRFVRMLVLEREPERHVVITPPEHGAVAPNVVRVPEAPVDAAVIEPSAWEALADWVLGGGRLAACAIVELARLATISTPQFAVLIGEVAAQRALEVAWSQRGPLRGGTDVDTLLQPLVEAARHSARAAEALVSALAHAAGATRRRKRP